MDILVALLAVLVTAALLYLAYLLVQLIKSMDVAIKTHTDSMRTWSAHANNLLTNLSSLCLTKEGDRADRPADS